MHKKIFALVIGLGLFAFVGSAAAKPKHNHHNMKTMLGANAKKDGPHQIDKKGDYTVTATTKGGKVADVKVKHAKKGDIAVKKYKSNKKYALLDVAPSEEVPAQDMGTTWIGYAYVDDLGNEEIYWVEYDMVLDPSGAIDYVPVT